MKYSHDSNQNVVHRKIVVPWYETERACIITIGLVLPALLFAIVGIYTAVERSGYQEHIWVPVTLLILSASVILSILVRLVRRYLNRFRHRYLKGFSVEPFK